MGKPQNDYEYLTIIPYIIKKAMVYKNLSLLKI